MPGGWGRRRGSPFTAGLRWLSANPWCISGQAVEASGLAQSTVSRHLRVLRQSGLLCCEPSGTATCCCVDAAALAALAENLESYAASLRAAADACCSPAGAPGRQATIHLHDPSDPSR